MDILNNKEIENKNEKNIAKHQRDKSETNAVHVIYV
jgi:hypothetical protein